MPQNSESSIPLDDDDILDLTEMADPGKNAGGPPEPGDGVDFGADLDALLDSLAPDGTVSAPAASSSRTAATESPVAAPIKDQTPVTHKVDPNEEMSMPETSDIDSLLAEFGADLPADSPEQPSPEPQKPVAPASAPASGFDGLLAQAQAAEAQKAAEEEAAKKKAGVAAFEGQALPPSSPAAEVAAQESPSAPAAPEMAEDEVESLDLNELDALLDDILAAAPEMRPPAQAVPPEASGAAAVPAGGDAPAVLPVPEAALMPNEAPDSAFEARIRRLEEAVEAAESEVANRLSGSEVQALIDAKLAAFSAPCSGTETGGGLSGSEVEALIDSKLAALLAPGSDAVLKIVEEVLARLAAPEAVSESSAGLREKLEKMAAAAAAKVIREEIAALVTE